MARVMEHLLPFYGLTVDVMQQRLRDVEQIHETWTIVVHDGQVDLQRNDDYSQWKWPGSDDRVNGEIELIRPLLDRLGNFRCVGSTSAEYNELREQSDNDTA